MLIEGGLSETTIKASNNQRHSKRTTYNTERKLVENSNLGLKIRRSGKAVKLPRKIIGNGFYSLTFCDKVQQMSCYMSSRRCNIPEETAILVADDEHVSEGVERVAEHVDVGGGCHVT